jgi:hypothetical protein
LHWKDSADLRRISAIDEAPMDVPDFQGGDLLAEWRVLQQLTQSRHMLRCQRIAAGQLLDMGAMKLST